ncbi:MAG TPA: type IV secretion system DNA-binding domain-containing protein [Candidatus Paceibacterota bacterium]
MDIGERIIYFAETDYRNKRQKFGIKEKDRDRHMYVIGKTGMGKSTLLENLAIQDIQNGSGIGFIDPHGGSAELLLDHIPASRVKDVIYFAPFDTDNPISFNVMEDVGKDQRHLVADGLMAAFKKIWPDVWSARMEYILNNILLALIEYPDSTLLGVNRMLADKSYRDVVVTKITDPAVRAFWLDEFAKYTDRYMQEAGAAIQNKIGQFVSSPIIRNIIGQPHSSFDIREAMDSKKILIMNLSKGRMGENNASLLGGMLITKMYLAAMSRANLTRDEIAKMPHFFFYVDEFQSFVNESFANILAEARKYKLDLTIAHQYVEQMPEEVRDAVFGNVGTTIAFRVGPLDAELLEKVFAPKFMVEDLVNLGRNQIYLSLMIDGIGSPPFSAVTLPPVARPTQSLREDILDYSRKTYAKKREGVEGVIRHWHETPASAPKPTISPRPAVTRPSTPPSRPTISPRFPKNNFPPRPARPVIPREAMEALGSSNLKSLLENAIKESGKEIPIDEDNDNEEENEEGDQLVYKPDVHDESESISEKSVPEKKEISPEALKKILNPE